MMKSGHPIIVAGGGLAGLTLGILLRRESIPVELHEAGSYPRHRVCGEFICGLDNEDYARMGLNEALQSAVPCRSTAWYFASRCVYRKVLPRTAYGISRHLLDRRLAAIFQNEGGVLRTRSRLAGDKLADAGVVDATGREAAQSAWIGLKFHARGLELAEDLELHLGDGAYLGISRIEDGGSNLCGLFRQRAGLRASRRALPLAYMQAAGMGYLVERLEAAEIDDSSFCGVTHLNYRNTPPVADRLRLGDAAGLIPPFTGNGMSIAMGSAELALPPLREFSRGRLSWTEAVAKAQEQIRAHFRRRQKVARMVHPFMFSSFGQGALRAAARAGLLPFGLLFHLTHD